MTRALIYARVSLDQTGEGRSVVRQEDACRALAAARDYDVVGVETDSQSAYVERQRPGWERAKAAVERGEADVILAWQLDRITRSLTELEQVIELTERTGASIVTVSGELDLTSSTGRMLARILGAVARAEVETKAARQRLANQQRAAEGKPWPSGPTLFGYGPGGEVVEAEAEAIQQAADDVLVGVSCYSIARRWSEAGLFPRSTRRQGGAEPRWTPAGVKLLLINPRLAGLATYQGKEVGRGTWVPILDEAQHIQLKAFLTDPSRRVGGSTAGPKPTTLLSTLAVCGRCGGTLSAGKNRGEFVYICKAGHVQTPRQQADMWVRSQAVKNLALATSTGAFRIEEEVQVDMADVEKLRKRLDDLAASYAEGAITISQLNTASERLRERIEDAEQAALTPASSVLSPEEAAKMFLEASLDGQRAMLREAFVITVHPRGRGKRVPIQEQVVIEPRSA
jgi:site-specific DNA recombinase